MSTPNKTTESERLGGPELRGDDSPAETTAPGEGNGKVTVATNRPALHIDIQVHIDATASAEQIDFIFASMAKHLYGHES